jgi:ATP synthase F1 complex assembly factor 2
VTLDGRALKTPGGAPLRVPPRKALTAALVAAEWENQDTLMRPHTLPMTSLVSRAIDAMHAEASRAEVRAELLKFLHTDTVLFVPFLHISVTLLTPAHRFPTTEPESLVALQAEHWAPLLAWARDTLGVQLHQTPGLQPTPQPAESVAALDALLAAMSPWELAAMERATHAAKSVLVGLALVRGRLSAEAAAVAATVEVNAQIQRWGSVEDTHDVDHEDVRRQLGSAAVLVSDI